VPRLALTDLAARWRALRPGAGGVRVLAVEGRSGSGKTTLAAALAALVPDAVTVAMDEIYPGWDGLAASVPLLVRHVLAPLAAGTAAAVPRWDWPADRPGAPRPLAPSGLLLVEGIGCGARAAAPYLAATLWVEAPAAVRRARALARDGATYAPHWDRWAAQEDAYLAVERPRNRADLVVDGTADVPDPAGSLRVAPGRRAAAGRPENPADGPAADD